MKYLGLDLGSRTGWCVLSEGACSPVSGGYWDLVPGRDSSARSQAINKAAKKGGYNKRAYDPRPEELYQRLFLLLENDPEIVAVGFEDVRFVQSLDQGQLWASLRAAMWLAVKHMSLPPALHTIDVGTLKKFATGKGNAQKELMMQMLYVQHDIKTEDDNHADACWIAIWLKKQLAKGGKLN